MITLREVVVDIADLKVSCDRADILSTYALGSCLGVAVYDPIARVGGILHAMLPDHRLNEERAKTNPEAFVTTGIPMLFRACYRLGAVKRRMQVRIAGAATFGAHDSAQVGRSNFAMLRELLHQNHVKITESVVGGAVSRSIFLSIETGRLRVVVERQKGTA